MDLRRTQPRERKWECRVRHDGMFGNMAMQERLSGLRHHQVRDHQEGVLMVQYGQVFQSARWYQHIHYGRIRG